MFRLTLPIGFAATLAGCSGHNMSPHTVQFSGDTIPFPVNYESEAAKVIRERGGDLSTARVSEPKPTLGVTAFSPKRWYVCVKGIPAPQPRASGLLPLDEMVDGWLTHKSGEQSYNVLLFFSSQTASRREGYDSPLCRDLDYREIKASPPDA